MDNEPEGSLGLWAVPRIVVVTQFVGGAVFLLMAVVNVAGADPGGRFLGVAAALVAGMAFGVAGSLRALGRMVRRHMETWHPDAPVIEGSGTRVAAVDR
jgi:hypothetical protein